MKIIRRCEHQVSFFAQRNEFSWMWLLHYIRSDIKIKLMVYEGILVRQLFSLLPILSYLNRWNIVILLVYGSCNWNHHYNFSSISKMLIIAQQSSTIFKPITQSSKSFKQSSKLQQYLAPQYPPYLFVQSKKNNKNKNLPLSE